MDRATANMIASRRRHGSSLDSSDSSLDSRFDRKLAVISMSPKSDFSASALAIEDLSGNALLNACDKLFALFTRRSLESNALMERISGYSQRHSPWNGNLVEAIEIEMKAIASERTALEEAFHELGDIAKRWNLEKAALETAVLESRQENAEVKELFTQMCTEASQKLTIARDSSVQLEGSSNRKLAELRDRVKVLELELFVSQKNVADTEAVSKAQYDKLQMELQRALSVSAAVRRQWMHRLRKHSDRKLRQITCKEPLALWRSAVVCGKQTALIGFRLQQKRTKAGLQQVFSKWADRCLDVQAAAFRFAHLGRRVMERDIEFVKSYAAQRSRLPVQADRLITVMGIPSTESVGDMFNLWRWYARASAKESAFQNMSASFSEREGELLQQIEQTKAQAQTASRESDLLAEIAQLKQETEALSTRESNLMQEMEGLKAKLESASTRESSLMQELDGLKAKLESASTRESGLVQEVEVLKSRTESFSSRESELVHEVELLKSQSGTPAAESVPSMSQDGQDTITCTTEDRLASLQKDASLAILSHDLQFVQEALKLVLTTIQRESQQPKPSSAAASSAGDVESSLGGVDEPGILGLAFDDDLVVIDIVSFSPADDCGRIAVGDRLVSINGKEQGASKLTREEAASELFGPAGSVAEIVVERANTGREHISLLRTSKAEVLARWALRKDFETLSCFVGTAGGAAESAKSTHRSETEAARSAEQLEVALRLNKELTEEREAMSKAVCALRTERDQYLASMQNFGEHLLQVESVLERLEAQAATVVHHASQGGDACIGNESSIVKRDASDCSTELDCSFLYAEVAQDEGVGGGSKGEVGPSAAEILLLVETLLFVLETATGKQLKNVQDSLHSAPDPTPREAFGELRAAVDGLETAAKNSRSMRRKLRNMLSALKKIVFGVVLGMLLGHYLDKHKIVDVDACVAGVSIMEWKEWRWHAEEAMGTMLAASQHLLDVYAKPLLQRLGLEVDVPAAAPKSTSRAGWFSGRQRD